MVNYLKPYSTLPNKALKTKHHLQVQAKFYKKEIVRKKVSILKIAFANQGIN